MTDHSTDAAYITVACMQVWSEFTMHSLECSFYRRNQATSGTAANGRYNMKKDTLWLWRAGKADVRSAKPPCKRNPTLLRGARMEKD